jgi:hypothetical protein
MDKSKNKYFLIFKGIICFLKWVRRLLYIIIAAFVIGFSNAFYNECRMINDTKNFNDQEQVIDDEDTNA